MNKIKVLILLVGVFALSGHFVSNVAFADGNFEQPGKEEKCPVCGMFTYKYPDWIAQVTLKDGQSAYFDGAKDMFKYLLNMEKYAQGHDRSDVLRAYVTEYYELQPIDAESAYFVVGSDVLGPMGRELVPFATMEAAREFLKDHKGTKIVRFDDVSSSMVQGLD